MNTSEYEVLAVLAEELNMRKAAARLYVTQSALSQRLQAIEASWNAKIFIRSPRGLLLTPEGEKIVQLAKEIVQKTNRVKEEIKQRVGQISGTLTISGHFHCCPALAAPRFKNIHQVIIRMSTFR